MKLSALLVKIAAMILIISMNVLPTVSVNPLFTSNMVLQRNLPVKIYGTGSAEGEIVAVTFKGQNKTDTVFNGEWSVTLDNMNSDTIEHSLVVRAVNTITLTGVLVGDVWLLGGQSNMARRFDDYVTLDVSNENQPLIRLVAIAPFTGDTSAITTPSNQVHLSTTKKWRRAVYSDDTMTQNIMEAYSPAGFYFAKYLQPHLKVPIGLIMACYPGTRCECWAPWSLISTDPDLAYYRDNYFPTQNLRTASWLYNTGIHPITRFAIKGVLWYQGESNSPVPYPHGILFPKLIKSWRDAWGQGDFPFIFAQLASFGLNTWDPTDMAIAYNREAQTRGLSQRNTGMITLIDAGERDNNHPETKELCGYRFFMKARAVAYGETLVSSGPVYDSFTVAGSEATVFFSNTGSGIETRPVEMPISSLDTEVVWVGVCADSLHGFEVAGPDSVYHDAAATIEGTTVKVSSPLVASPIAVRYAWKNFSFANLYNAEGFPAEPFRSDTFPGPEYIDPYLESPSIPRNRVLQPSSIEILPRGIQIDEGGPHHIRIFDLKGTLVYSIFGRGPAFYPLTKLEAKRIYVLQVKTGKAQVCRKIIPNLRSY